MVRRFVIPASLALAVALFISCTSQAFYWVNWPGSGDPGSSTGSQTGTITGTGTGSTGTGAGTGTGDPGSSYVPEPASLIAGLAGLGTVGLVRRFRRK